MRTTQSGGEREEIWEVVEENRQRARKGKEREREIEREREKETEKDI